MHLSVPYTMYRSQTYLDILMLNVCGTDYRLQTNPDFQDFNNSSLLGIFNFYNYYYYYTEKSCTGKR